MVDGQTSRVYEETSYAGRTASSFEKLHVQNGPSVQEVAAYPWCAACKPLRSSTCPKTRRARKTQSWKHCKSSRTGRTHLTLAGRRGLSALTNAACSAALSSGRPSGIAATAPIGQSGGVGVSRKNQKQPSMSHHIPAVINSPHFHDYRAIFIFNISTAQFPLGPGLLLLLWFMTSPWGCASPLSWACRLQSGVGSWLRTEMLR